jgi:hypothetical protein
MNLGSRSRVQMPVVAINIVIFVRQIVDPHMALAAELHGLAPLPFDDFGLLDYALCGLVEEEAQTFINSNAECNFCKDCSNSGVIPNFRSSFVTSTESKAIGSPMRKTILVTSSSVNGSSSFMSLCPSWLPTPPSFSDNLPSSILTMLRKDQMMFQKRAHREMPL